MRLGRGKEGRGAWIGSVELFELFPERVNCGGDLFFWTHFQIIPATNTDITSGHVADFLHRDGLAVLRTDRISPFWEDDERG